VRNNDFRLSRNIVDRTRSALRNIVAEDVAKYTGPLRVVDAGLVVICLVVIRLVVIRLVVIRLVEETASLLRSHRTALHDADRKTKSNFDNINPLLDPKRNMERLDLDTFHGAATHILGKTPAQICHGILPKWSILHCENILRNDLMRRFLERQQSIRETLTKVDMQKLRTCVPNQHRRLGDGQATREQLVHYLTKPRLTFHGTRRELVPSILQHSFLKPGDKHPVTERRLAVDNGSAYGRGIYSSPEAWYALMYAEGNSSKIKSSELRGLKLIVCATIMGRTARMSNADRWQKMSEPFPGADSHVNASQYVYIVFDSA
jgi:hypothetical protein